jgi:hypothetical protein
VQELMHVIGRVGMKQQEAVTQLLALASNHNLNDQVRGQALGGLLQAKCYDHSLAIQLLGKLATQRPKEHIQWMALHIQHGLIAHTQHCTNGHYEGTSPYSDLLQEAREGLAAAVQASDASDAARWLDALGNSNSQSSEHTAAVAAIAANHRESQSLRLVAIRNLGKLWTPAARAQLQQLALDNCGVPAWVDFKSVTPEKDCRTQQDIRRAAKEALTGEYLETGDPRRPSGEVQPLSLDQTEGEEGRQVNSEFQLGYEKSWPIPSSGDLRAEPKVGITIGQAKEKEFGAKKGDYDATFCIHGYGGVDVKAWDWTIPAFQAGAQYCLPTGKNHKTETKQEKEDRLQKYIKVLGVQVWPKNEGVEAFELAGGHEPPDQQGKCGYDINGAPLKFSLSWSTTFFEKEKVFMVGPCPINGNIKADGEVGVVMGMATGDLSFTPKGGHGNVGTATSDDQKEICALPDNAMMFFIPYIQMSLTGELSLDLLLAKGGVGVNVVLVKFSLPATNEVYKQGTKTVGTCGGTTLKIEGLGGKIYAFLDLMKSVEIKVGGGCWCCFWEWKIERVWHRAFEFNFYEWAPPAEWSSDTIKCKGKGLPAEVVKEDPPQPPPLGEQHHLYNEWGSQKCLGVHEGGGAGGYAKDGAQIETAHCDHRQSQKWLLEAEIVDDHNSMAKNKNSMFNGHSVVNRHNGNKCIEVANWEGWNYNYAEPGNANFQANFKGRRVQLNRCTGAWNQQWRLNGCQLINTPTGMCADISGGQNKAQAAIVLYPCTGQWNQCFLYKLKRDMRL